MPTLQAILDRINAAGVNHAPKAAMPQQTQQQQTTQGEQPKQDANCFQLGNYVFNPYQHTLTGPDGVKNVRPQYCNALTALCDSMGEDVEIAKMFNITDDRGFRVLMFNLRKLFSGDPNVQIVTSRGGKARIQVNQGGLNESMEEEETDYDMALIDTLSECGWSFHNFYTVESKSTGKTGTRYEIDKDSKDSCSVDKLKQRILSVIPKELVIFSEGQHRYAPEMKQLSVVLLDA